MTQDSSGSRRFAVALSFPGEHRAYVEQVAKALLPALGEARVFYDAWHESKVIGYGSNRKLQKIYATDSDLIVPFYCQDYLNKKWCGVELRAIEALLIEGEFERVLPFRFDIVDIPSSFKTDIFPVVTERLPEDIARLILERYNELQGNTPPPPPQISPGAPIAPIPIDISRIDKYAPEKLIGREKETKLLDDAWAQAQSGGPNRPHILTFVALGGEGKTSLVAKWAAELAAGGWLGCEAAFDWTFYNQGTHEQLAASSDLFFAEALKYFGDAGKPSGVESAHDKGKRLARIIGEKRALLILDGLEPLQYPPTWTPPGALKDEGIATLLKGLARQNKGLCVVTTRYSIPDLRAYRQGAAPEVKLLRLSKEAGVALLKSLGVIGAQKEFEALVEEVKGHALTLNLLGSYLRDAHAGDIRKRDLVRLEEADDEQGGHAFRVMDAYAKWFEGESKHGQRALALLRLLGLFDRPADAGCLKALWKAPGIPDLTEPLAGISEAHRNIALTRLADARLLTVNRDGACALVSLDAHPLLREYFAKELREKSPEAWQAAHKRLFEHLCKTTSDKKPQPSLEDLQPLYQAVAHGCQAGMQQEAREKVYRDRIQHGQEAYSSKKLGAFGSNLGAVACFFEPPWSDVSPALKEADQAWLLNEAAVTLRALGRLTEALEPMRAGLKMRVEQEVWKNAAIIASNLSELELTLGETALAVANAAQAVTYADDSGDAFWRMGSRTTHADALHQAGRRAEAATRFGEAEAMHAERQPDYPLLYSLSGFRYCDLLLAAAERAAWRLQAGGLDRAFAKGEPEGSRSGRAPLDREPSGLPNRAEPPSLRAEGEAIQSHGAAPGLLRSARNDGPENLAALIDSCRAVSERAAQTIEIAKQNNWLLDIALDNLTLGRAALYAAILQGAPPVGGDSLLPLVGEGAMRSMTDEGRPQEPSSDPATCPHPAFGHLLPQAGEGFAPLRLSLDNAMDGLRRAGAQDHLPRGLLTRAMFRALAGDPAGAQEDLDEAWDIATRGPMPLFMADIHLHRARLFGAPADLAEARQLIDKHGYGRRKEELADAEAALLRRD